MVGRRSNTRLRRPATARRRASRYPRAASRATFTFIGSGTAARGAVVVRAAGDEPAARSTITGRGGLLLLLLETANLPAASFAITDGDGFFSDVNPIATSQAIIATSAKGMHRRRAIFNNKQIFGGLFGFFWNLVI